MTEQWKEIPGYDGWYEVSSLGRVRSWIDHRRPKRLDTPRIMKAVLKTNGRLVVSLCYVKRTVVEIHRLVALAFLERPPGVECVRHRDGNPSNNVLGNLVWGTFKENMQDKTRHGTDSRGTRNGRSKLTEENVREIRSRWAKGSATLTGMAKEYGVTKQAIKLVTNRKNWGHV